MFKIVQNDKSTYCEVPQTNPLRWKTLFREADGSFVDQSGWIKCKDFYNDTVAYFKEGSVFSIYSYKNAIKKNEEGVYFLLKFIADKESFLHNIEALNPQLSFDLGTCLECWDQGDDEVVILIPNELWESTYQISLVTMMIRLCNYGVVYEKWDDFFAEKAPINTVEHAFTEDAKKNAQKWGFKVPEPFGEYWYYCGPEYNSKVKPKQTGGYIHNNGVSNWSEFMKQEGL
jgi:hypothetical protein